MKKLLVFMFLAVKIVSCFNYLLTPGEQKCFYLDIPSSIVIVATYTLVDRPPEELIDDGIAIKVIDSSNSQIFRSIFRETGKFSFTSQEAGQHKVCIQTTTVWTKNKIKLQLNLNDYQNNADHNHPASKDDLNHIDNLVSTLNQQVEDIIKTQEYSREKEASFKDESEEINSRIFICTSLQTIVILISGFWQFWNLRQFFISKRMS